MAKHRVTWFVLADGSRARFITRRAEGAGYDIVGDYESPEAHLATHEIMSDRPGRSQESGYSSRHAIEPRQDAHQALKASFVHGVAGHLNAANARGDFDALVIYAAPRALAELRASLDEPTQQKIKAEVAKDLTKVPVVELPEHFAKVG
jgi:protein required for attachment to host cells